MTLKLIKIYFVDDDALVRIDPNNLDPRVTCFSRIVDFSKTIDVITSELQTEYGYIYFWDLNRFIGNDNFRGFIKKDSEIILNPSFDEITVSEYFENFANEQDYLVFYRYIPAIGGPEMIIDWFASIYNIVNGLFITQPLLVLFMGTVIKGIHKWVVSKFQNRNVNSHTFLDAIYSRETWELEEFDQVFGVNCLPLTKKLLIALGYRKKAGVYILTKKKSEKNFKFISTNDDV